MYLVNFNIEQGSIILGDILPTHEQHSSYK